MAEKPEGDRQGVGGGVKLLQGIDTTKMEELPWGDNTPRVTPRGDRVPGEDGQGREGDKTPFTTRETKAR